MINGSFMRKFLRCRALRSELTWSGWTDLVVAKHFITTRSNQKRQRFNFHKDSSISKPAFSTVAQLRRLQSKVCSWRSGLSHSSWTLNTSPKCISLRWYWKTISFSRWKFRPNLLHNLWHFKIMRLVLTIEVSRVIVSEKCKIQSADGIRIWAINLNRHANIL